MLRFFRRLFSILFWWLVVIGCVAAIGYLLWPLLADKFYSLCSNNSEWKLCRGQWWSITSADDLQKNIEKKAGVFADISKTAASDILTDKSGKRPVVYRKDKTGTFMSMKE